MAADTFGARLKKLRTERNISQEAFAELFYLHRSSVSKYEQNRHLPEIQVLICMADFFNVSLDYLLGRTTQPKMLPDIPKTQTKTEFYDAYPMTDREAAMFAAYFDAPKAVRQQILRYIASKTGKTENK